MNSLRGSTEWHKISFWKSKLNRASSAPVKNAAKPAANGRVSLQSATSSIFSDIIEDGYHVDRRLAPSVPLISTIRDQIMSLESQGIPATFVMLFDELWELWREYPLENPRLHPTFDILAFYVDPRLSQSGFSPHRDRQPLDVSSSFQPDGLPKYVTRWIAITDADAESNSCLYVIPKRNDPGYMDGDDDVEGEEGGERNIDGGVNPSVLPLQRALSTKESYQYIRALPIPSGSSLLFSHRIIHWGSSGNPKSTLAPRIAVSFTYSDPTFEKPYLKEEAFAWKEGGGTLPEFPIRLLLCCCQMLIYYQRFGMERDGVMGCYEYVKEHGGKYLEEGYMRKVLREFVQAVKEGGEGGDNDSEVNESDEERMLEEMLDQADEFEDDYEYEEGEEGEEGMEDDFEDEFDDNERGEGPLLGSFPKRKKRKQEDAT